VRRASLLAAAAKLAGADAAERELDAALRGLREDGIVALSP
jgi:hypothetical protein